jgi:hypothetical protein
MSEPPRSLDSKFPPPSPAPLSPLGLGSSLASAWRLSSAKSRSISAENPTGGKGEGAREEPGENSHARLLGRGWKVRPYVVIPASTTQTLAEITGPGALQQLWMTLQGKPRHAILRMYWDHSGTPSVECPLGDFFAQGWDGFGQVSSLAVCVNPNRGFNCYWEMPFRRHCLVTLQNLSRESMTLYYQINYTLCPVPEDAAYFHAHFRRSNPLPDKQVHTLLDGVSGQGQYVGTYIAWSTNTPGWWGEGEVKFYLDGDQEFPTICGTGTEDYFGGAWNFDAGGYQPFTGPYSGLPQIVRPDGLYQSQMRFGMYRWHLTDPVRFERDLRVTIQALGYRKDRFIPLHEDIASVAYWYQTLPSAPFPPLPDRDALEVD